MAFIAHNVYKNGIDNTILNQENKVFLALLTTDGFEEDGNGAMIFNKDKVLAISELRAGVGTVATNNSDDLTVDEISSNVNAVGKFDKKVLTVLPISYNRTAAIVNNSGTAGNFALIKYNGTPKSHLAYEVDTDELDSNNIPVTKQIFFNILSPNFYLDSVYKNFFGIY